MIKSVFDDTEAQELEESFNPITVALTDALFGEAHPFGSKLRKIVSVEDIVKLIKAEPRIYAGKFISRGGTATLMLKFFF